MKNRINLKIKLFFIVVVIVLVLVLFGLSRGWQRNHEVSQEINGLQTNIQNLQKDNLQLKELVQYLNSDAYVEEKARIDLGLKIPEEKVVVVSQTSTATETTTAENLKNNLNASNFKKWWRFFFN